MRLVTWNIQGGLGMDGRRTIRRIGEVLELLDADVVCLQEVHYRLPWSRFADQPGGLSRVLACPVRFHAVSSFAAGGYGNAILTRLPVSHWIERLLPNERERRRASLCWERRGLLEATVEAPWGPVRVITGHWSLDGDDRRESASAAAHAIRDGGPCVICGDFNAGPDSPEMRLLRCEADLSDRGSGLTYPSDSPTARIDYVLTTRDVVVQETSVVHTLASDHLPVTAVLADATSKQT